MRAPKVYVITLNWNGASDTCACIDSVRGLDYPNFEIVLCDNASKDDSIVEIRAWAERSASGVPGVFMREMNAVEAKSPGHVDGDAACVTLIHTGANLGYAGGMNSGIRYALARGDADYVWILNNDTALDQQALRALVDRCQQDPKIGICGSTLLYFSDRNRVQAFGGAEYQAWRGRSLAIGAFRSRAEVPDDSLDVERRMAYVIGASMLVPVRFLLDVGLMDESYFLYSEEHDWAHRGLLKGYTLGYAPRSIVYHKHGATIGTSPSGGSELSLYYLFRSKVLFTMRFYSRRFVCVLPLILFDASKFLLRGFPGKSAAALRGICAAIFFNAEPQKDVR